MPHWALQRRLATWTLIKLLLAAGAGINDADHFGPPIWLRGHFNQFDAVKFLLAHGAEWTSTTA